MVTRKPEVPGQSIEVLLLSADNSAISCLIACYLSFLAFLCITFVSAWKLFFWIILLYFQVPSDSGLFFQKWRAIEITTAIRILTFFDNPIVFILFNEVPWKKSHAISYNQISLETWFLIYVFIYYQNNNHVQASVFDLTVCRWLQSRREWSVACLTVRRSVSQVGVSVIASLSAVKPIT